MTSSAMTAPLPNEDRISHEHAVWRTYQGDGAAPGIPGGICVSLEYGSGPIVEGMSHQAHWAGCTRWRFGWAPR